ncbi:MAG: hypothetical protein EXX96DRAFT_619280 [Benjaminiella poitrasii]|nr:MAG: hypothetical protein EXX96DRAFT_619280 [Benjaminiella poitrasii]
MLGNNQRTPYEILGVGSYSTQKEIRNRYLELCKTHHPDISKNSKVDFTEITVAYDMLTRKKRYQHRQHHHPAATTVMIDTKLWTRRTYLAGLGLVFLTFFYFHQEKEQRQLSFTRKTQDENSSETPWQKEGTSFREWRRK